MVGRPRQFDEEQVLDAAMRAFWAHGYEATSLADLLDATGLHKGSLYQAFGDKHRLFVSALRRYLEGMRAQKNVLLRNAASPLQGIRDVAHAMVELACEESDVRMGCMAVNALVEMAPHDPEVAAVMKEHLGLMKASLLACIVEAQAAGEIAPERDPEVVTLLFMTFMAGVATGLKGPLDREQAHRLFDAQIDAVT